MSGAPALFLDRDGVINVDHGHVGVRAQFDWVDGIFDLVRTARACGYLTIVVTNQAGIAKGKYTEAQFLETTAWMMKCFESAGAPLTAVYYCPFHPEGQGKYRQVSELRKPAPGMLLLAARERNLQLADSLLIGDQETDIQAGRAAGVRATALFAPAGAPLSSQADVVVSSHVQSAQWITRLHGRDRSCVAPQSPTTE